MIIVNVMVPALEKVYNFSIEEKAPVAELIEELVELIIQKERVQFSGNQEEMILCCMDSGIQCRRDRCLSDYGICGGAELILV